MKTKNLIRWRYWLALLVATCWLDIASAYYDPGPQRWINRDPIEEGGGKNLSTFSENSPIGTIDAYGTTPTVGSGIYGDCTKEQHSKLHKAASIACKSSGKMKCEPSDTCEVIKEKMGKFDACIAAKSLVNDTCFGGESSIYAHELKELNKGRTRCSNFFCLKGCK